VVDLTAQKQQVCDAGRRLLELGLVAGTWGNVSIKASDDLMLITPSGVEYGTMTAQDIVEVSLKDGSYTGGKPSSERHLHIEIYNTRKGIGGIVREVPPILDDLAQIVGPRVRVADYALPGTKKLVRKTIKALKGCNAVLLANHGAICIGRDIEQAILCCQVLEKACKSLIEAEFLGGAKEINRFEAWIMHQYYLRRYSKQK
jgi:L-fuculose-phosphate aldolase